MICKIPLSVAALSLLLLYSCDVMEIRWKEMTTLPPQPAGNVHPGVAGPYAGMYDNILLVAGGANFEGEMPWRRGEKSYHTTIYGLDLSGITPVWLRNGPIGDLPAPAAYGASVTTPSGVVCMGGENNEGISDAVFNVSFTGGKPCITYLPPLPLPLSNTMAAMVASKIFIAGGISPAGNSQALFCLDTQDVASGWVRLKDMPLAIVSGVMVTTGKRNASLWVLGGRTREPDDDASVIRSEVFRFSVKENEWYQGGVMTDGTDTFRLAAGTATVINDRYIVLFGGNDGNVFTSVETLLSEMTRERDTLAYNEKRDQYVTLQETHPGFSRDIITFDTETMKCFRSGSVPGMTQVTTVAVSCGAGIIIPAGEIRPGIRTPAINMVTVD